MHHRGRRALVWIVLAATCAVSFVLVALVGSASAAPNPTWFEELPTVDQHAATNFIYEQSPEGTVPYSGEASEVSQSISHTFESETSAEPFYDEVSGGVATTEEDVTLIPEVGAAVPELYAAGGAFLAGWEIGEGINAIFADIGLGFGSVPGRDEEAPYAEWEFCYEEKVCGASLRWQPQGTEVWEGATVQQWPGAYLYSGFVYHYGSRAGWFEKIRWNDPPCEFSGLNVPPGANVEEFVPAGTECWSGSEALPQEVVYPYASVSQVLSHEEFHRYDPLIDGYPEWKSAAPEDPGTATVEEMAAEGLDESEFLQAFLEEAMESKPKAGLFPDPKVTEKKYNDEERRCDRGTSRFDNVGGNEDPEPFAKKEPTAYGVADPPEGYESVPVYLRWGTTHWVPADESFSGTPYIDLWGGWGYRHITAKHGWNALDQAETTVALATGVPEPTGTKGKYLYEAPALALGKDGVECVRKVVVDFEASEGDPEPRGIVTSYNVVK